MAKKIANKFPIDSQTAKAVGVSIPFTGNAVFNSTYTTKDQIKSNLINYFLTNRGERVYNPQFGGNLRNFIFEQVSNHSIDFLKKQIQDDISQYFPQVKVIKIEINQDLNTNNLHISLTYNVIAFGIEDELNLTFQ